MKMTLLRNIKKKRLTELKEFASKTKYGKVYELRKQDYIQEVNKAPQDVFVVLHLYQTYVSECNLMNNIFDYLAPKYPTIKFMKITATNCVENFRDDDCPTLFIYQNGKLFKEFLRASYYFGGKNLSWKKVEWIFASLGILKTELNEDPFEEFEYQTRKKKKNNNEDSEDEKDDREYYWQIDKKKITFLI